MSLTDALKAGDLLVWIKGELKRVRVGKIGFQQWIEEHCKIPYKRVYIQTACQGDGRRKGFQFREHLHRAINIFALHQAELDEALSIQAL